LVHTFEDFSNQIVNDPNCLNSGDGICDTPADPYNENRDVADYVQDCRFIFEDKDANGAFYDPQVSNIMSYYPCSCEFTEGQLRKMAANYLSATKSNW